MAMTDPIADMLTRIRNANVAKHDTVEIPASRMKVALTKILREEGYIKHYKIVKAQPKGKKRAAAAAAPKKTAAKRSERQGLIRIYLKFGPNQEKVINGLRRVSRPGLRRYVHCEHIPEVRGGLGIAILSTPKGVVTGQQARQERVGGELLAMVW